MKTSTTQIARKYTQIYDDKKRKNKKLDEDNHALGNMLHLKGSTSKMDKEEQKNRYKDSKQIG